MVLIGLLGGSVAEEVRPYLQRELNRWFAAKGRPQQPIVIDLAISNAKQPQQVLIVANTLLLGGEFDLIINLDGFNEIAGSIRLNFERDYFPFFPGPWDKWTGLAAEELRLAGQIGVLRREQARLAAVGETSPLRWSALFGLVNRYRQERVNLGIIRLNHQLAATAAAYGLEKHGPRSWLESEETMQPAAARVWYRGSVTLARLAKMSGAEYYHFLQPSHYAPAAKPLSREELELFYKPDRAVGHFAKQGYPLLLGFNPDLRQAVNYFDLTGIFADHTETLYRDSCCHLNERGYELLAAAMVERIEPDLLRLGQDSPEGPVLLAAGRRPAEPDVLLFRGDFQVYLQEKIRLRYFRDNCAPAEVEPGFFLHLTPRDLADLPAHRREHGFDNQDFSFAEVGGIRRRGQCLAQIPLPDYPLAHLRTGQYVSGGRELWAGSYSFPE